MRLRDFQKLPNGSIVRTIPFGRANAIEKRLSPTSWSENAVYGIDKNFYEGEKISTINKEIIDRSCFINGFFYPYFALQLISKGTNE